MEEKTMYELRGVSASKTEVHKAIRNLDKGLFPGAFCSIFSDPDPDWCNIQHADGAGSKVILAYLFWKETGDKTVWRDIAQDSIVMNLDDLICAGATGPFLVTGTIDRNKRLIPEEVLAEIINGTHEFCELMTSLGIPCHYVGGETADLGDNVRTITVNHTFSVRFKKSEVIDASRIEAPALIVGFSSTGRADWEKEPNSGIGSNGLTNARHDMLSPFYYKNHKEAFDPNTDPNYVYCGSHRLTDNLLLEGEKFSVGGALLSPTRTYAPLMQKIFTEIGKEHLLGLIHCTGGGQTKIGKFGPLGITYLKDNLFPIPPLFEILQSARKLDWREMHQTYNMGHRFEAVVKDEKVAEDCISLARNCGIDAEIIGRVIENKNKNERKVIIKGYRNDYEYIFE